MLHQHSFQGPGIGSPGETVDRAPPGDERILLGHGSGGRLTQRLLELLAVRHGVDLSRLCWIALGSEGRADRRRGLCAAMAAQDSDPAL